MKLKKWILLLACLLLLSAPLYLFRGSVACQLAPWGQYQAVRSDVFLARDSRLTAQVLEDIQQGVDRVEQVFGPTRATPRIIVAESPEDARWLFASPFATSHFNPIGSCIVLGPSGQNVDVIAHELVHAEVHARLGWWGQIRHMPRWFEEGMALMVDWREPYRIENIQRSAEEIEQVKTLVFGHQFYTENQVAHYQAARLAVDSVDPATFYSGLEQLGAGEELELIFSL